MRYLLLVVIILVLVGCGEDKNIFNRSEQEMNQLEKMVYSAKVGDVIVLVPAKVDAPVQMYQVTKAHEDSTVDAHKYNLYVQGAGITTTQSAMGMGYFGAYYKRVGEVFVVPKDKVRAMNSSIKEEVLKAAI